MKFEIAPKETEILANWDDARLYCFSLNIGGKTGWRLPTKDELSEIYQSDNDFISSEQKTRRSSVVGQLTGNCYWSSSERHDCDAFGHGFNNGYQNHYGSKKNEYYVRAIRDL